MSIKGNVQPARKSYFFSKGYIDLKNTIVEAWRRNKDSIIKYKDNLSELSFEESLLKKIFVGLLNILAMISVIVFGSIITAVVSITHIIILLVFMLIVYVCFSFIWCVDRIYLKKNEIFTACHECKEKTLIPTYICANCGAEHTKLTPGVYGILHRTCNCGAKLPTTFFNGRKHLRAICPYCKNELMDRESRPICIPVIGGRSVGKTAYITAFSKEFIDNVSPSLGMSTEFYSTEKETIFREIESDYRSGGTRMTRRSTLPNSASSISFSFFVKHSKFKPERLIHIYDIAGEVFTNNDEDEVQKQYEYCQGIVLMIDPFSIPALVDRYQESMNQKDKDGIGTAEIAYIMDSFLEKLRQVTGLSDKQMSKTPLAVVIGKIDTVDLQNYLGEKAIRDLMATNPELYDNYFDAEDYICRQFLIENGMQNFVSQISTRFKNNRFFACSAIGHTKDSGAYTPIGVLEPMEWLFQNADNTFAKIWNTDEFTKLPLYINPKKKKLLEGGK